MTEQPLGRLDRDAVAAIVNDRTMINDEGFVQNSEAVADAILALAPAQCVPKVHCNDEANGDLAELLAQFTGYIMNERVRAYNEGLTDGRAALAADEEIYRGLQEAKTLLHSDPWAAAGILNRILSAVTSTHSSPPPVEPSPQGRPSGSGLKDGSGGGEACPVCMGSGYSAHPDSGEVCHVCKGQGTP